jgi:hypothetical protein
MFSRRVSLTYPFKPTEVSLYLHQTTQEEGIVLSDLQEALGIKITGVTNTFKRHDQFRSALIDLALCVKFAGVEKILRETCGWSFKKIEMAMIQLMPSVLDKFEKILYRFEEAVEKLENLKRPREENEEQEELSKSI